MAPTTITAFNPQIHIADLRAEARLQLGEHLTDNAFIGWLGERLFTTRQLLTRDQALLATAVHQISTGAGAQRTA